MAGRAYNPAIRTTASTFGVLVGVAGFEHGLFELLQGGVRPDGVLIEAIGPAQRFWEYGTETALTVLPSFLLAGLLSMAIGVLVVLWAAAFVQRRFGAPVLFLLGVGLFLVGGGFAPILLTILAGATAAGINRPLSFWQRVLPLRRFLARLWPGSLAALVAGFVVTVEIAIFGYPLLWLFDPATTFSIQYVLAYVLVGLMVLSVLSGIARDLEGRAGAPGLSRTA